MAKSAKRKSAGGTPALDLAASAGVAHVVHAYEHDASAESYGLEAAAKLGVDPATVFKTLVAQAGTQLVVGIVPVSQQLDLKALAAAVGAKSAAMADMALAERTTGYVAGGISPLGQKKRLATVIDVSAQAFATINVSAGRRGLEIELSPDDLAALTHGTFGAIAK